MASMPQGPARTAAPEGPSILPAMRLAGAPSEVSGRCPSTHHAGNTASGSSPTTSTGEGSGDFVALAEVFRCHERSLRALAFRLLGDAAHVDDVLQDAYLRAHRGLHRFRGNAALSSWVYRIVQNTCLDELRRRRPTEELGDRPSLDSDPAEMAIRRVDVASALAALDAEQRAAVVVVGLGFEYGAASEILSIPVGTLASRLHRGRAALRSALREQAA